MRSTLRRSYPARPGGRSAFPSTTPRCVGSASQAVLGSPRWLVAAASETSYSAISSVIRGTGHKIRALELRPFPLTRAIGHPTVIGVSVSSDGCDVVVVRQWEPHTYQSVYWEAGSVSDGSDLVRRLTEVVENTIDLHNLHNPEVSLTPDVPMAVAGGETEHHANLGMLVAANVGPGPRAREEPPSTPRTISPTSRWSSTSVSPYGTFSP